MKVVLSSTNPPSKLVAHAVAVLFVAVALIFQFFLNTLHGQTAPFMPFFAAVMAAAWYGGLWPGLVATITSGIIAAISFIEPFNTFSPTNSHKMFLLVTFVGIGGLVSWLHQSLKDTLQRTQDALRKQQESEEKASVNETRFRRAIEEAPFPIMLHAEDGTILSVNRTWTELTGYHLEQLPKLSDWIEQTADNKELARREAKRALRRDSLPCEVILRTNRGIGRLLRAVA